MQRVIQIISEHLGAKIERVTPEARLLEDLNADSLERVNLVVALEDAFKIQIPDSDAKKIKTVGAVIAYITEKTKASDQ